MKYQHRLIHTNGIKLHVVSAGPKDSKPVFLLHGFPEFWYGWRHQIDHLAGRGFRVHAPDQRGYNYSAKPKDIPAYRLDELAADVTGLFDALDCEQAAVVGHDWGAAVAWWLAIQHPHRLSRLGILNVPHPAVMLDTLKQNPEQRKRSWYIGFFQIPWLPENLLAWLNRRGKLAPALAASARPGSFSADEQAKYQRAWAQPGVWTATINWYRALIQNQMTDVSARVSVPTLMIWGKQDSALVPAMAQSSIERCDKGRLVMIEDATHWVQHDAAGQVNQLLYDFLADKK